MKTVKAWKRLTGPSQKDGSVIVDLELPSTSSLSASEMLSAGSMRTTRELVSVPATSSARSGGKARNFSRFQPP